MAWAAVLHKTTNQRQERSHPTAAHRTQALRLGQQIVLGSLPAPSAAQAYADLADARIRDCAAAAFGDRGLLQERVAVFALGALGARQMTAASPIDLIMVHDAHPEGDADRLAADCDEAFETMACSVSGSAREALYTVQVHQGGAIDPIEARLRRARPARLFALPQARLVWSTSPALGARLRSTLAQVLRQPRDRDRCARTASALRSRLAQRHPSRGIWDCEREPGGLLDIEYLVRRIQIAHGSHGAPLIGPSSQALAALRQEAFLDDAAFETLSEAFTLQQQIAQTLAAALPAGADPDAQLPPIQAVLACAAGSSSLDHLQARLKEARAAACAAIAGVV